MWTWTQSRKEEGGGPHSAQEQMWCLYKQANRRGHRPWVAGDRHPGHDLPGGTVPALLGESRVKRLWWQARAHSEKRDYVCRRTIAGAKEGRHASWDAGGTVTQRMEHAHFPGTIHGGGTMILTDLVPVEYLCKDQTTESLLERAW